MAPYMHTDRYQRVSYGYGRYRRQDSPPNNMDGIDFSDDLAVADTLIAALGRGKEGMTSGSCAKPTMAMDTHRSIFGTSPDDEDEPETHTSMTVFQPTPSITGSKARFQTRMRSNPTEHPGGMMDHDGDIPMSDTCAVVSGQSRSSTAFPKDTHSSMDDEQISSNADTKVPSEDVSMADTTSNLSEELAEDDDGPEDSLENVIEVGQNKYHLRPQARECHSIFSSTWMDADETGDYNPDDERRPQALQQKRMRIRNQMRAQHAPYDYARDECIRHALPVPEQRLMVTLKHEGKAWMERLGLITSQEFDAAEPAQGTSDKGYHLRRQDLVLIPHSNDIHTSYSLKGGSDPPSNLTGHPEARGCKACLEHGTERCSLLEDERTWPCVSCFAVGDECELIIPPTWKITCEQCKHSKQSCSFAYTSKHDGPCQQCAEDGDRCVAGPILEAIYPRIRYERDRKQTAMFVEKALKAHHRLKERCKAQPQRSRVRRTAVVTKRQPDAESANHFPELRNTTDLPLALSSLSENPLEATPVCSTRYTVATKFCHPIAFNHPDETRCHFCTDAIYAMIGLAEMQVEVIEWADGRGLGEVSGGHQADGIANTTMCLACTTHRAEMVLHAYHRLRPIRDRPLTMKDFTTALKSLLAGEAQSPTQWCSICVNLAAYKCCVPGQGCGLQVCETCFTALETSPSDWKLQEVLRSLASGMSEERRVVVRADAAFLRNDGLLMRNLMGSVKVKHAATS